MNGESEEKRQHDRYVYKTRVWLESSQGGELNEVRSVNISAGGLLIRSSEQLPLGSHVKILFELPFIPNPVTAVGRVVHTQAALFNGEASLGLELVAVEGITEDQLIRFLGELLS